MTNQHGIDSPNLTPEETLAEETSQESATAAEAERESVDGTDEISGDDTGKPRSAETEDPLQVAQAESARLRDQLLRTAADFDNYRKRTRRELEEAERRAREELLRELLPVFDNLERASAHTETAVDLNSLANGIAMVRRQFLDTLAKLGVERLEAIGKPFDPALHEAIQQVETDEFDPGTVANEYQPGYRMGERLLRPAMVVVAKKPNIRADA